MHGLFVLVWLLVVGSNVTQSEPPAGIYQGVIILAGAAYVATFFREELGRLLTSGDYLFFLFGFAAPVLLMVLSDRSFERGEYTTQIGDAVVFVVACTLALRPALHKPMVVAAYAIVVAGVAVNLYELLVQNNLWSVAPGRSAGFYKNPNFSGQALLGFGLVVLTSRFSKLRLSDWILIALILVGVFTTFSRTAILASLLLLTAVVLLRVERGQAFSVVVGVLTIPLATYGMTLYALNNIDLSPDASMRLYSLLESFGFGDYDSDRGDTASASLDLVEENPMLGTGVRTIYEMIEGPHNMFIAMLVDYGVVGLLAYVLAMVRLTWIGLQSPDREGAGPVSFFVAWLVLFGLASHTLLGDTATIPLIGYAVARAVLLRTQQRSWRVAGQWT